MAQIQTRFITNNAITNAKLDQAPANTIKGNDTSSTANEKDLTVAEAQALLVIPTSSTPLPLASGGTGASAGSANVAFNALSPLTTKGDVLTFSTVNARLPVGTNGDVITADSAQALGIKWAAPATPGTSVVGTINTQTSSADGLVISGANLYAQFGTTSNPGMLSVLSSGALNVASGVISVKVDSATVKINGSNQLEGLKPTEQRITLNGTDITNQYVDLSFAAYGTSASANSVGLFVVGGPMQQKTVDYTVSLVGGSGGVTRISFAGDLATGGAAALISNDVLAISYEYLT